MTPHRETHAQTDSREPYRQRHGPSRILVFGADGQLGGKKLEPTYQRYDAAGVEIVACDIVNESKFNPKFGRFKEYYNLGQGPDREKLFESGRKERFDLCYEATWPDAHLLNLVNWEAICRNILVTKPFASIKQYHGLKALMELAGYGCVLGKLLMHDHYANKPAMAAVLAALPKIHHKYGKFSRVTVMITERRTVNDPEEVARHGALNEGMVPDLASHALMLVQLLTPKDLVWQDEDGSSFKRLDRDIVPTTCTRAQMKNAAVAQDVDTACVIEYRVTERLTLVREDGTPVGRPFLNEFYVLVVCGKGLRVSADSERDLKALEICFQGQGQSTGVIDLETNTLNEVLKAVPGIEVPDDELRVHRGINRPMLTLLDRWQDFDAGGNLRAELFQLPQLIWENMTLLANTMAVSRQGILPSYERKDVIHYFVNTHIGPGNGFRYFGSQGSGWPMKEPPFHLMRGRVLPSSIA